MDMLLDSVIPKNELKDFNEFIEFLNRSEKKFLLCNDLLLALSSFFQNRGNEDKDIDSTQSEGGE